MFWHTERRGNYKMINNERLSQIEEAYVKYLPDFADSHLKRPSKT